MHMETRPKKQIDDAGVRLRLRFTELALNLWWTWHPEVIELFRDLDPSAWRTSNHNPMSALAALSDEELVERVEDRSLEGRLNFQCHRLQNHLTDEGTWCATHGGVLNASPVAYFSAEFGVHESLPLYSGGLGLLAGDHLKSASDLGVPIVAVGLFYAQGYFRQQIDAQGEQRELYGTTSVGTLPLVHAARASGEALTISVECGTETLEASVWIAHVGRVPLVLLDSDVAANPSHLRSLTGALYGGDQLTRIRQEILLGIGGLRALRALGVRPRVLHLNEGHSAFAILERARERVELDGVDAAEALRLTALDTVFTTHTPVAAGNDRFDTALLEGELAWLRTGLGLDSTRFTALGSESASESGGPFCMTALALRHAWHRNAVSHLHGHVARQMWRGLWPGTTEERLPIHHVTNGVHVPSWLAPAMKRLYDRYLPTEWLRHLAQAVTWRPLADIDDDELWEVHSLLRRQLLDFVGRRSGGRDSLVPTALTIGCARRFATYKRATLFVSDLPRLERLLANPERPVQVIVSGKAHPRDDGGKRLLAQLVDVSRDARFRNRIVFVEDYDINVARHLVQGVDVWLNTPLRPLEACGTSGQKVLLNGGLNVSTLDGWWAEAYDGSNGFAIGEPTVHADPSLQWSRDATSLYEVLEREVVPLFYARDEHDVPRRWVARMKHSIMSLGWRYNADRMVMDYVTSAYLPAAGGTTSG